MNAGDPKAFGKVGLLMGGWSAERDISLKSGAAVLAGLQAGGVDVEAVDVDRGVYEHLKTAGYDRVFNVLHGRGGEDGTVQAMLDLLGIPYTGTGVLGSALAMDKLRSKHVWRGVDLPTPPAMALRSAADCERAVAELGLPLAVKPVFEGSSVGISKVKEAGQLIVAWRQAEQFGEVMAERWVNGTEYTVSVLDGRALPVIRLETAREFYDFTAKYADGAGTQYHCPCGLAADKEADIQRIALQAFDALGGRGWGRVDLFLDGDGQPWLIEVNTIPGMTDHSLVPMAAKADGIEFNELVLRILASAPAKGNGDGRTR